MLTPDLSAIQTLHRFRKHFRAIATAAVLIGLVGQLFSFGGATTASAQVRQEKPASKTRKAKKKKSQTGIQTFGPFTMPASPEVVASPPTVPQVQTTQPSSGRQGKRTVTPTRQQNASSNGQVASERVTASATVQINLRKLAARAKSTGPRVTGFAGDIVGQELPAPGSIEEVGSGSALLPQSNVSADDIVGPFVPSPAPSSNYLGAFDGPKAGTGIFTIPPDTMGAVGFDKVVTYLNNNIVIQNKLTGAPLSTANIDTFWAATGATGSFDPRVQFDPYNNRWLIAATSNAQSANSSLLLGISDTSDPQGTYTLYRFIVGCSPGGAGCNAQGEWADFPMLGFNKNWIAIGWNQFTISTSAFVAGKMAVLDYPTLRTGTANGVIFTNPSAATGF